MIKNKNLLSFSLFLYILMLLISLKIDIKLVYISNLFMIFNLILYNYIYKISRIKQNSLILIYLTFFIYTLFSLFLSIDLVMGLLRSINILFILINLVVIYNIIIHLNNINPVIYAFILFSVINFLLLNNIITYFPEPFVESRFVGTLDNSNTLAIYLFLTIFLSMYYINKNPILFYSKYLLSFNILFVMYTLTATGSKKGIILTIILILIYLVSNIRLDKTIFTKLIKFILIFTIIIFTVKEIVNLELLIDNFDRIIKRMTLAYEGISGIGGDTSTTDRLVLIEIAFEHFLSNPLFGIGNTSFTAMYGFYAHNNYVDLLANLGIIGFLIYYSIHVLLIIKILKIKEASIKFLFLFFILTILLMDIALVSYYSKILIIILSLIYFLIEKELANEKN